MATTDTPGFDLNAHHDGEIWGVTVTFNVLSVLAVIGRLYSLRLKRRKAQLDDFLVCLALILQLALSILVAVGVKIWGVGRHADALDPKVVESFLRMVYICSLLNPCILTLAKISILLLYRRIFVTRFIKVSTTILLWVVAAWWVAVFFADAFICMPPSKNWKFDIPGSCGDVHLLFILSPIPWIITDFLILLLPIPSVMKLQLPKKDRIGLCGIFLLGGFACIASVVRYSTVFYADQDATWSQTGITIWSVIESSVTVISACLIVMKPVFDKFWPSNTLYYIRSRSSGRSRPSETSVASKAALKPSVKYLRNSGDNLNEKRPGGDGAADSVGTISDQSTYGDQAPQIWVTTDFSVTSTSDSDHVPGRPMSNVAS